MKKDIEWLKEEIEEDIKSWGGGNPDYFRGASDAYENVKDWLNQLDEPEVLMPEWIEDNEFLVNDESGVDYTVVESRKLKGLLVPKQELPVIPKFVAEWIKETKPYNSLRVAFEYIAQRKRNNHDDKLAFWVEEGNSETFARAWLDDYEVEEEQKYYVLDKENATLLKKSAVGEEIAKSVGTNIYNAKSWKNEEEYQLTEQEIKDYDERYWPFAVKVEEME